MCPLWPFLWLTTYRVANIFDCFSNVPSDFAEAFLNFASSVFCATLSLEFVVVDGASNSFFRFAFYLIEFAFNFVSIR
jgi:hypothetical protein